MASSGGIAISINKFDTKFNKMFSNTDTLLLETRTLSKEITNLRQLLTTGKDAGKKQSALFTDIRQVVNSTKEQLKFFNTIKGKVTSEVQEIKNSTNNLLKKPLVSIQNELQNIQKRVISNLNDVKSSTENLFKKPFNDINKIFKELRKENKKYRKPSTRIPLSPKNRNRFITTTAANSSMLSDIGDAASIYDVIRGNRKGTNLSSPKGGLGKVLNGGSKLLGGLGKGATRAIPIAGAAIGALSIGSAVASGDSKKIGSSVGGTGGAVVGGVLGSVLGPAGTVAGAALGGVVGDWIGEVVGGFFEETNEKVDDNFKDLNKYNKKQENEDKAAFDSIVSNVTDSVKNAWDSAVTKISSFFDSIKLFFYDNLSKVPFIGDYFKGKADAIRTAQSANVGGSPAGGAYTGSTPSGNAAPFSGGQRAGGVSGKYGAITGWRSDLVLPQNQRAIGPNGKPMEWSQATNNPGNVGNTDQGRTNIFPDLQSGIKAQAELLQQRYSGMTLEAMAKKYTPTKWHEALPTWMAHSGLKANEIPNLQDPAVLGKLLKAIHVAEGSSKWVPKEEVDYALGLQQMPEGYKKKDYRQLTAKGWEYVRGGAPQTNTGLSGNIGTANAPKGAETALRTGLKLNKDGTIDLSTLQGYSSLDLSHGGVDISKMDPETAARMGQVAAKYEQLTGQKLKLSEGYRDFKEQQRLFNKYGPGRAALPGKSNHGMGTAFDIRESAVPVIEKNLRDAGYTGGLGQLLSEHGLSRPLLKSMGETWHVEALDRKTALMQQDRQNRQSGTKVGAAYQNQEEMQALMKDRPTQNSQGDQPVPVAQNAQAVAQNNQGGQPVPVAQNNVQRGPLRGDATELLKYLDELDEEEQNKGGQPVPHRSRDDLKFEEDAPRRMRGDLSGLINEDDEKEQNKGGQPVATTSVRVSDEQYHTDNETHHGRKTREPYPDMIDKFGRRYEFFEDTPDELKATDFFASKDSASKKLFDLDDEAIKKLSREDLQKIASRKNVGLAGDITEAERKIAETHNANIEKAKKALEKQAEEQAKPAIQNPATAPKPEQQTPQMASSHTPPQPATPAPAAAPQSSETGGSDPFSQTDYSLQAYRIDPLSPVGA